MKLQIEKRVIQDLERKIFLIKKHMPTDNDFSSDNKALIAFVLSPIAKKNTNNGLEIQLKTLKLSQDGFPCNSFSIGEVLFKRGVGSEFTS